MLEINNQYNHIRAKVQTEVLKQFFGDTLEQDVDKIPFYIIPKERVPARCCIYKERAMIRYRIMAMLGINIEEDDDEMKSLSEYVKEVLEKDTPPFPSSPPSPQLVRPALRTATSSAMHVGGVLPGRVLPTVLRIASPSQTARPISMRVGVSVAASAKGFARSMLWSISLSLANRLALSMR